MTPAQSAPDPGDGSSPELREASAWEPGAASQAVFDADLARRNDYIRQVGALCVLEDGTEWVDPARLPEGFVRSYTGLLQYGAANGLIYTPERAS